MTVHFTKKYMLGEYLREMIQVAEYCINYRKEVHPEIWKGQRGCYGYPAALVLLVIVNSIGKEIERGGDDTSRNFNVLNNKDYYNLNLSPDLVEKIVKFYRHKLAHEGVIGDWDRSGSDDISMIPGVESGPVFRKINFGYQLNLKAFLNVSKKALEKFLDSI